MRCPAEGANRYRFILTAPGRSERACLAPRPGLDLHAHDLGVGLDEAVPEFNSTIDSDHLLAVGSIDERMLILVDLEKLMSSDEMGLIEKLAR